MKLRSTRRLLVITVCLLAVVVAACVPPPTGGGGGGTTTSSTTTVPAEDELLAFPMLEGFTAPTDVEFTPAGRVFVSQKDGTILTFDSITDTTPTVAADLTAPVRSIGEHGLLGLEVDPQFPARPYVYVMYAWDSTGLWGDACIAGYGVNGCVTGARIARLTMNPNGQMVGAPTTIVDDRWCYQFSSHGVGDLEVLDDGTLLASSGEGAYWAGADYGQKGGIQQFPPVANLTPRNACGDPPNGVGGPVDAVTSEGGSFRSQDLLTPADPLTYDGSIIRIDPDTGQAPPDNPLVGVGPTSDDAVIGHGMRNPFRLTARPGTDEVYAVDVGAGRFEEINQLDTGDSVAENFGWPCKEGPEINRTFEALNNNMCDLALGTGSPTTLTDPWFSYLRAGTGGAISGIAIVPPGRYDSDMVGDLIFSDYVQGRTWTIGIDSDGSADDDGPEQVASEGVVVDLTAAPDGYLYSVDYYAGSVNRLVDKDAAPVARIAASPAQGQLPLTVALDASASAQPGGGALTFAWDLDDDGQFDDATGPTTSVTLTQAVNREVSVKVINSANAFAVASTTVYPGNSAPTVAIDVTSPLPWTSDGDISFSVAANDLEDGVLPASSVSWNADLLHCYSPSDCHQHPFVGETGSLGSTITGPSHGYPSFIRLTATATDSRGQTTVTSLDLHPAAVTLQVTSNPPGAVVSIGDEQKVTPFTHTAIKNDSLTVATPSPQTIAGQNYSFSSWSNGQPASHQYAATADATLTLNLSPTP